MLKKKYDKLGILHGRLDDKKKQSILTDFKTGQLNLNINLNQTLNQDLV